MKNINNQILYIILLLFSIILFSSSAFAVKVAPRISDREIIEKLAGLEAGQAALRSEMEAGQAALRSEMKAGQAALRSEMKAGQAALGKRIDDINKRIDDINKRIDDMNQRLDDMNQRISSQQNIILSIFSAMVALILALFAYIAWDRRTMLKPVVQRLEILEKDVIRELDIYNTNGSVLIRLVKVLKELAKNDTKLASVLRSFSLL